MPATAKGNQQDGQPQSSQHRSSHGAPWQPTADEKADLAAIDVALDRMKALTGPDPYVLTIPQDVEPRYHHAYQSDAQQWLRNTPFAAHEHESLQYQTFFFYEHGKQMYVQQSSRPQEPKAGTSDSRSLLSGAGASTPSTAPKKKITLDAYKKKQNGVPTTPEPPSASKVSDSTAAKQAALKGPVEKIKAETEEMLAAVNESDGHESPAKKHEPRSGMPELKRKRGDHELALKDDDALKPSRKAPEARQESGLPNSKKLRPSPSPVVAKATLNKEPSEAAKKGKAQPEDGYDDSKLPPRLSPGMPPRLSPLRQVDSAWPETDDTTPPLPNMLSPTIPGNITGTLKARDLYHNGTLDEKSAKRVDDTAKRKSPIPRNGFRASSSSPAVRSDAEDRGPPAPSSATRKPPSSEILEDEHVYSVKKLHQLRVRLKYRKSQKDAILRILKMRPSPALPPLSPSPPARVTNQERRADLAGKPALRLNGERVDDKTGKVVAQKGVPTKKEKQPVERDNRTTGKEKRALADDDRAEPSAKRRQQPPSESRKEPSTPVRPALQSPIAISSGQKGHLLPATPNAASTSTTRKELLAQSMKREYSQESFTTHTPSAMAGTPSTHGNHTQATSGGRPASSQPTSKTPRQQAWEAEQKRLEVLGRELKHDASAHLNAHNADSAASKGASSSPDQKLAAAKSLESLLCYLLSFTCIDEAALAAEPKRAPSASPWHNLQVFYSFVKRNCEPFPLLCGVVCALGVALNARVLAIATQFPPPSASSSSSSSSSEQQLQLLHQTAHALQRAAADADARLGYDVLSASFPRTWAARSTGPDMLPSTSSSSSSSTSALEAAVEPSKLLAGAFRLPLGFVTPPFRAARAGHAMLREWVENEELKYSFKLKA